MLRQPAKAVEPGDVRRLIEHVRGHRHACRDRTIILLSFKAGLRACEIAGLTWSMVLASDDTIADHLAIAHQIAKYGSARRIPLHKDLARTLRRLHASQGRPRDGPVILSERGGHMTPRSIVNWFAQVYAALGLSGCSSHSGRRTFITSAARVLASTGGSLRDIQELAGHRAITTTERYIEGNRVAQRRLIARL